MMVALITTWGILLSTIVTAVATLFLWRVTRVLALETKRMADASGQPQVVASLEPNQWSIMHIDLSVENTGNAAAFDVEVAFDPPLTKGDNDDGQVPYQRISLLKPGQQLSSYLGEFSRYRDQSFTVSISWAVSPQSTDRQSLVYTFSMADFAGTGHLESPNPLVKVAEHLKHLREDWKHVSTGFRKISTNTYDESDRARERAANEERRKSLVKIMQNQPSSNPKPTAKPKARASRKAVPKE